MPRRKRRSSLHVDYEQALREDYDEDRPLLLTALANSARRRGAVLADWDSDSESDSGAASVFLNDTAALNWEMEEQPLADLCGWYEPEQDSVWSSTFQNSSWSVDDLFNCTEEDYAEQNLLWLSLCGETSNSSQEEAQGGKQPDSTRVSSSSSEYSDSESSDSSDDEGMRPLKKKKLQSL